MYYSKKVYCFFHIRLFVKYKFDIAFRAKIFFIIDPGLPQEQWKFIYFQNEKYLRQKFLFFAYQRKCISCAIKNIKFHWKKSIFGLSLLQVENNIVR